MQWYDVLTVILVILGSLFVLLSAVAMLRARDAVQMMNVFSPATGFGLPLITLGVFVHLTGSRGFSWWTLLVSAVTVAALIIVSSLASNSLARAIYQSGSPLDPRTSPQDLAATAEEAGLQEAGLQGSGPLEADPSDSTTERP